MSEANGGSGGAAMVGGPVRSLQANAAVTHFRRAIQQGTHWYVALLESVGLWEEPAERFRGRVRTYLIGGEALDWLWLADRLCTDVRDLIPATELNDLLFHGNAPIHLETVEFRELIGPLKYGCFLNYFYGVTVEEALFFALEEEARRHSIVPGGKFDLNPLYLDLYGSTEETLLREFLHSETAPATVSLDVQEQKAFTYFLFKRRVAYCLPARVASDTKRGLAELRRQYLAARRSTAFPGRPDGVLEPGDDPEFRKVATA